MFSKALIDCLSVHHFTLMFFSTEEILSDLLTAMCIAGAPSWLASGCG
jgi:hypothetical protein